LPHRSKAQVTVIDVFFACLIFFTLFALLAFSWNYFVLKIYSLDRRADMENKLMMISDLLIKYPGNETFWDLNCNPKILGLGKENVLEKKKLDAFANSSCLNYSTMKQLLGSEYEFYFEARNSSDIIVEAGQKPIDASEALIIKRSVLVDGQIAFANFMLWR